MNASNKLSTDLNRLLKSQNFKNEQELQTFLSNLVGQTIPEFEPEALSNEEKAEDLIFEAYELQGEEAFGNVLEALHLDHDCIPAYEFLGAMQAIHVLAVPYYAYGIELGRKKFAKEIKSQRGHFWSIHETRPFMRCMINYAICLVTMNDIDSAMEVYKEIIALNKGDNMGVRNQYGLLLISKKMYNEYLKLDKQFHFESSPEACFNRLLHSYVTTGESQQTVDLITKAKMQNKYFIGVLTSKSRPKSIPNSYEVGSKDEALIYGDYAYNIWHDVEGAIAFLNKHKK